MLHPCLPCWMSHTVWSTFQLNLLRTKNGCHRSSPRVVNSSRGEPHWQRGHSSKMLISKIILESPATVPRPLLLAQDLYLRALSTNLATHHHGCRQYSALSAPSRRLPIPLFICPRRDSPSQNPTSDGSNPLLYAQ